jgi:protease YdgD
MRHKYVGHSVVESFLKSPEFAYRLEDRPRWDMIDPSMIRHNWAILNLRDELTVKPIPLRSIENSELPPGTDGEIALAGYASDREYVLSVHKGCVAKLDEDKPGVITHWCDTIGESGAPILLFKGNDASISFCKQWPGSCNESCCTSYLSCLGIHGCSTRHMTCD